MNYHDMDTDDLISTGTIGGSALGTGWYIGRHPRIKDFNPFGEKNITVIGGVKQWDPVARKNALNILRRSMAGEQMSKAELDAAKRMFALDSFSGQTLAAADAMHESGFNVSVLRKAINDPNRKITLPDGRIVDVFDKNNFYKTLDLNASDLKGADAILQVGDGSHDTALKASRRRGSKIYRLLTDYGDGNFKQPDYWLGGQNWMKVRDPKLYDRLFVPGGDAKELWTELGSGRSKNVNIGDIAVSPIFKEMEFAKNPGSQVKAMLTIGGGAGGSLALRNNNVDYRHRYDLIGKNDNLLDDILNALRKKHGDNVNLDVYLGSAIQKPKNILNADGSITRGYAPSDVKLGKELQKLRDLLDPTSERYKRYAKTKRGLSIINDVKRRYKGLRLIESVPQDAIGKAYASSDYVFALPGSTTAEFSAIKGNRHGGLIHLIPSEESWSPRHFRGNANYVNSIMQPGARHNIVSLVDKNRGKALLNAVMEGGFKDWGRHIQNNNARPLDAMVKAIKMDIIKQRLGRVGKLGILAAPMAIAGTHLYNKHRDKSLVERIKELLGK